MWASARLATAMSMSLLACACSIHPVPKDVTGVDTFRIVLQIRCEARTAVMNAALRYLNYKYEEQRKAGHVERALAELLPRFNADLEAMSDRKLVDRFVGEIRQKLDRYLAAAISLEFALRMSENNDFGGGTNLLRPLLSGMDVIGLTLGDNHSRETFRNFRITETWADLTFHPRKCAEYPAVLPNYNYPMAGGIGLDEMVDTYTRLNEQVDFAKPDKGVDDHAFVDVLKFTTLLSASVGPGFEVASPAGRTFLVQKASGSFGIGRTDEHQLTVAVFIPATSSTDSKAVANKAVTRQNQTRFLFGLDQTTSLRDQLAR